MRHPFIESSRQWQALNTCLARAGEAGTGKVERWRGFRPATGLFSATAMSIYPALTVFLTGRASHAGMRMKKLDAKAAALQERAPLARTWQEKEQDVGFS